MQSPIRSPYHTASKHHNDICKNRHRGNENSQLAFKLIAPKRSSLKKQILEFIRSTEDIGATSEEISYALGIRYTSVSARISEIKKDQQNSGRQLIKKIGQRPTSGGAAADIYIAI